MPTVTCTPEIYTRHSAWLLGVVDSSELGSTTIIDGTVTNITSDVLIGDSSVELEYGVTGVGALDRVADTGTLVFSLDNSPTNSHGQRGAYSPGHANALSGWDIGNMIELRITYSGTTYYKFTGHLSSISPSAGQYLDQKVDCIAVDWMDEAAITKVKGVTVQTNKRSDELIQLLVDESVTVPPKATEFAEGQSTFVTSFDNLLDAQTSVLRALYDCVISELGYLYIKGDTSTGGVLTFEDRYARPKTGAAVASFDNTMTGLTVSRTRSQIINTSYVVVHPRTTDTSTSVLYELTTTATTPEVPPNSTITINCPYREASINAYRVAAATIITPVSATDWIANSASDGTGLNLTSDVAVTVKTQAANAVDLEITNNNVTSTAYLTTLQVRGTAIRDVTDTVLSARDNLSIITYGERDTRVDMKYESNAGEYGNEIANWILNIYKDPRYAVDNFQLASNSSDTMMTNSLAREPGDKISFAEAQTGITTSSGGVPIAYFINAVRMSIAAGNILTTSWVLAPATATQAWVLDQVSSSELGYTTNLGFA
jgi:hypothetical protein